MKLTTEQFIEKAQKIHGTKYNYSLVDYKYAKTKVEIVCPEHGVFWQIPNDHLNGSNCPTCSKNNRNKIAIEKSKNIFNKKAALVHNNFYDYSLVDYKHSKERIKIVCPEHGVFEQTPNDHLRKKGCPLCANKNRASSNYLHTSNTSENCYTKLYCVNMFCKETKETFFKIGLTKNTIKRRFGSCEYNMFIIKPIYSITINVLDGIKLEKDLNKLKEYKYTPKIKFAGWTECYHTIPYLPLKFKYIT